MENKLQDKIRRVIVLGDLFSCYSQNIIFNIAIVYCHNLKKILLYKPCFYRSRDVRIRILSPCLTTSSELGLKHNHFISRVCALP